MATLDDLAQAIMRQEGYGTPGAVTITGANNPGALRDSPYAVGYVTGASGKFAKFASYEDGYNALLYDLQSKVNRGLSLRDFVYTYAPPSENDSTTYLNNLSGWLGISADTKLGEWLNGMGTDNSGDFGASDSGLDTITNDPTKGIMLGLAVVAIGLLVTRG
jgi:hypothetical protein